MTPVLAIGFCVFVWWFGTGALLWAQHRRQAGVVLGVMTAVAMASVLGLVWTVHDPSPRGAYMAFCSAIGLWAWHELLFLKGWLTGPRREPCPARASGWRRFRFALEVVLHHELALAATVLALVAGTWGAPNQVGVASFVVLWVMRLSAKLNVFLGVRNLAVDFLPDELDYILSYFRQAPMNPLMPWSLLLGSLALSWFTGLATTRTGFEAVGATLVGTLLGLALLEHLFLVLPVPDAILWRWLIRRPKQAQGEV